MAARRESKVVDISSRRPPATTPEARENQMISLAYDVAEQQMRDGTASAQVITNFLKLGSSREKLEQQRLEHENALTQAKIDALAAAERIEELYKAALGAMSSYQGKESLEVPDDEEY